MASEVTLGLKIDLRITAQDIREPIFAYYHQLERSRENQEARQHGQTFVTKTFRDGSRYWVTLSFPDLPDILCLDEPHNTLRGIPLEEVISRYGVQGESFARKSDARAPKPATSSLGPRPRLRGAGSTRG